MPNGLRVSIVGFVQVVDDLFGKFDIEFSVKSIRSYEKFSIYIDGALRRKYLAFSFNY